MHATGYLSSIAALACALGSSLGCGGSTDSTPTTPAATEEPAEASAAEPAVTSECPELPGNAEAAFAEARAYEQGGGGGDEYETLTTRIQLYGKAAAAGHLEGQAIAGPLLFGTLFATDAPQPEEREVYVDALTYVFTAALRGHPGVLDFSPDVPKIVGAKQVPEELEEPLSDLDRAWIEEALANSLKWIDCYGDKP